ncbi:MAG: imelysin family protein [Bacteroidota bacterium]
MDVPASYPTQGFPALDYLINGLGTTDAAIVAFYTTDASAAKRIGYLKLIVAKMNTVFNAVNTEWNSTYRNTFVDKSSTDAGSSLSLMVNGYILNYERYIRSGKFGIPSGAMTNSGGTKFRTGWKHIIKKIYPQFLQRQLTRRRLIFSTEECWHRRSRTFS